MFRAHAGMSLFYSYPKTATRNLRQTPHLLRHQHHRPRHRPCILHNYLPIGSVALFLIVLTTVTTQTLKAARANPADALRDE